MKYFIRMNKNLLTIIIRLIIFNYLFHIIELHHYTTFWKNICERNKKIVIFWAGIFVKLRNEESNLTERTQHLLKFPQINLLNDCKNRIALAITITNSCWFPFLVPIMLSNVFKMKQKLVHDDVPSIKSINIRCVKNLS